MTSSSSYSIEIHEFSTGIHAARTKDGWVSQGFTGKYMNNTLNPIPPAVARAIRDRLFAMAEGASRDTPAIVGRVVSDESDAREVWSVVAVVSRGRDDRHRSASMYRYFLSPGDNSLPLILKWLQKQRQEKRFPVFDPFDEKKLNQPNRYEYTSYPPAPPVENFTSLLREESRPIIVPFNWECNPPILNELAKKIPIQSNQSIAWAYQIEALEDPTSFQIIYPGSREAEELLKKALANRSQRAPRISGEQAIQAAVKGIIKRGKVTPEQFQELDRALKNPQANDNYWKALFEKQGASAALKEGVYSDQMVRVLTLRAILLPATLSEYLCWMNKQSKQQKKQSYLVSGELQSEFRKFMSRSPENQSKVVDRVIRGVKLLFLALVDNDDLVAPIVSLLKSPGGLWGMFFHQSVLADIKCDLDLMSNKASGQKCNPFKLMPEWEIILNDLQPFWQQSRSPLLLDKYQPLAKAFEGLNRWKISAIFYQVSQGYVPKNIFEKATASKNFKSELYNMHIHKKTNLMDLICMEFANLFENNPNTERRGEDMRLSAVITISLLSGGISGLFVSSLHHHLIASEAPDRVDATESLADSENQEVVGETGAAVDETNNSRISPEEQQNAVDKIQITKDSLNQLIEKNFVPDLEQDRAKVERALLKVLNIDGEYLGEIPKELLVQRIINYQDEYFEILETIDGVIDLPKDPIAGKSTYLLLKCDLGDALGVRDRFKEQPDICAPPQSSLQSPPPQ